MADLTTKLANFLGVLAGHDVTAPYKATPATLTNAQIKALPTTAITIVDAPGANKLIVPFAAVGHLVLSGGAYTGVSGAEWQCGFSTLRASTVVDVAQSLAGTTDKFLFFSFPFVSTLSGGVASGAYTTTAWTNTALTLTDETSTGDYGGGNAANSLTVYVAYLVLDTATGVFE